MQTAINDINKYYNIEQNNNIKVAQSCLNEHGEVDAIISGGRLFHCAIVLG